MPKPSRRQFLACTLPLVTVCTHSAHASAFTYKFACNTPASHPLSKRAQEAADRISKATDGRLEICVLSDKGLVFNDVDVARFRKTLQRAGFYADWKRKYGEEAWRILETSVGGFTRYIV